MDNLQNAVELIKSLIFAIEGTEEEYGLLDIMDGYYAGSPNIIDVDNLLKEAKLFLEVVK